MGRPRKSNHHLPQNVYVRHGAHFFVDDAGKMHRLGKTWDKAAKDRWVELSTGRAAEGTVAELLDRFMVHREHQVRAGTIGKRTLEDNLIEVRVLKLAFGRMHYAGIQRPHIAKYLRRRSYQPERIDEHGHRVKLPAVLAPVRANREIALLSSAYSWAMGEDAWDIKENPCYGVRRNKEKPKDRCPDRWEIEAAKQKAPPMWRLIFDLAYQCGQRGVDIRLLKKNTLQPDGIHITQSKTGQTLVIKWDDDLLGTMVQILAWSDAIAAEHHVESPYIVLARFAQPYTAAGWKAMVYKIVRAAMADPANPLQIPFSFHDIRAKSATDEDEAGGNPQHRLGHTTRSQTDDYVRSKKVHSVQPLPLRRVK